MKKKTKQKKKKKKKKAEKKKKIGSIVTRTVWTFIMIGGFIGM